APGGVVPVGLEQPHLAQALVLQLVHVLLHERQPHQRLEDVADLARLRRRRVGAHRGGIRQFVERRWRRRPDDRRRQQRRRRRRAEQRRRTAEAPVEGVVLPSLHLREARQQPRRRRRG